ncbi:hypothetical protein CW304_17470 [Bacillus sp. UFRGS-B20]|nr:hypothetical protein CW304_17470 [Bacillus sp. UFRGS-B20]
MTKFVTEICKIKLIKIRRHSVYKRVGAPSTPLYVALHQQGNHLAVTLMYFIYRYVRVSAHQFAYIWAYWLLFIVKGRRSP